ncbi:hypothetical protein [Microbacterium sp.]|uniref:hypothetical protein n=1 Tax=Microbacterium sp. TaxID=51671 RepID=UPI0039E5032C
MDVLLTRNLKHFRSPAIGQAGVQVMTSDTFLGRLLTRRRRAVVESFIHAANARKNPPTTPAELADRIAGAGAPRFAERLRPHLDEQACGRQPLQADPVVAFRPVTGRAVVARSTLTRRTGPSSVRPTTAACAR